MNLRITPSFNTQNNRQNQNFKMRFVEPSVVEHIASRLKAPLEDALVWVRPVEKLPKALNQDIQRKAELYTSACQNYYFTSDEAELISNDAFPIAKLAELIFYARHITQKDVETALSEQSIQKLRASMELHPKLQMIARTLFGDKILATDKRVLERLAILKLFLKEPDKLS